MNIDVYIQYVLFIEYKGVYEFAYIKKKELIKNIM